MARLSLNGLAEKENTDSVFFMTMDKVKFRRPVVPGDQLRLDISTLRSGSRVWKMEGKAFVEQYLVAEAVLAATIA